MIDLIKKTLFTGIGIVATTSERVEELGKKFIEEAKLSEEDGKKLLTDLALKTKEARGAMEKLVKETVEAALVALDVPTKKEVSELHARLAELEKKLETKESV